ncbi:MAG TPA: 4Fe-4S cluster-binding domain-containing protein, partial [Candidatus Nitrosotenuis sp.]|nr:4Fe-4S cluster-binding domain-containing protein [Candidatus Nitrosotenuis sp.]
MRLFRRQARTRVLGPGERAVLWLQGCPLACPGCLVPESWDPRALPPTPLEEVVTWILQIEGIEGLTLTGGEPMAQAAALNR